MLSKRKIKLFKSLQSKKYRQLEGLFMVEGAKGVKESLEGPFQVVHLLLTEAFRDELISLGVVLPENVELVNEKELVMIGTFQSNRAGIAILELPSSSDVQGEGLTLALDDVRDPGNLGTLIRIADWYGIKQIVCSKETADVFNPKVINATMGSFNRVNVVYQDLSVFFSLNQLPVYGALLSGQSIYKTELVENAIILLGNESKGIADGLESYVDHPIKIPGRGGAESLNVAVAAAVIIDNFFR